MNKYFYITTTLPYVNAQPHIGHALEFVQADVIARRQRQEGKEVVFNVGTDEHGLKIFEKAKEANMGITEFVDQNVATFKNFCETFNISYDSFYRTSNTEHRAVAQSFRTKAQQNNDIYEKKYSGLYCIGCESFKTPKELVHGKCPDHNKEPIPYEEENYFFKLSEQKKELLNYIDTHPNFILPHHKAQELKNFVKDMEDISISRKKENLPRGVPVPGDEDQVMYVWFDALTNYVGAVGFPDNQNKLQQYRGTENNENKAVQICGPDNLRFQGAIRQGMLSSAELPFTKNILVHGMIMGPDGNKMSKSIGNVISPVDQYHEYGAEAVRYYLIAGLPTFGDAAYKPDDLINLHNSHLANSFGNLLNRVIHLANKKEITLDASHATVQTNSKKLIDETKQKATQYYNEYKLFDAANTAHKLAMIANTYMDEKKPRDKELSGEEVAVIIHTLHYYLDTIVELYTPIIPTSCQKARNMLSKQEKGILFEKL